MNEKKIIIFENTWIRSPVVVEIDVENKHIKTDATMGLDFYDAVKKAWIENTKITPFSFPLDDPTWTYEFSKGIPSGPLRL
jgi:hypothetical protein